MSFGAHEYKFWVPGLGPGGLVFLRVFQPQPPKDTDDLEPGVAPIPASDRKVMRLPSTYSRVSTCAHGVRLRDRCPVCEPVTRTGWSGFAPSDLPTTQTHRSPALVRECVQRAMYRLRARTALDEAVGAFERHLAVLTPDAPGLEALEAVLSKLDQARKILESDSFFESGPRL